MGLFKSKENIIGLDIGGDSVKLIELIKSGSGYQVKNFAHIKTPRETVEGGLLKDNLILINTLKQIVQSFGISNMKVATSITGQDVFVRHLTLPNMSNKELVEAVRFETETQLPIPYSEALVDFIKVADINEEGQKKQEVMLVAAKKTIIDDYVTLFRDAGLELVVMDVEPLAIQRMATEIAKINLSNSAYVIVNFGFSTSNVSIFENNVLRFTRTLPYGGFKLTQALMHFYNTDYVEAENTKKLLDFSGEMNEHGLTILLQQKAEVIYPIIENLSNEIRRSIEFYQANHREVKIGKIYLVGGSALLKGLDEVIKNELLVDVEVLNPVKFMSIAPQLENKVKEINDAGPSLAVAVGLALSEVKK